MSQIAPPVRSPGIRSILLGLFVLFQVIYLPLANFLQLVPREMPPPHGELDSPVQREGTVADTRFVQDAINGLGTAVDRWGELSGQAQRWSLFAPDVARQSLFPVVECYSIDKSKPDSILFKAALRPVLPADPANYCRLPDPEGRWRSYEAILVFVYRNVSDDSLNERGDEWRQVLKSRVRDQQKSLLSYFRWNLELFKKQYPDQTLPDVIVLKVMVLPSPRPGERIRPPSFDVPLARWFPNQEVDPRLLPVEAYDPVAKAFVRLPVAEAKR